VNAREPYLDPRADASTILASETFRKLPIFATVVRRCFQIIDDEDSIRQQARSLFVGRGSVTDLTQLINAGLWDRDSQAWTSDLVFQLLATRASPIVTRETKFEVEEAKGWNWNIEQIVTVGLKYMPFDNFVDHTVSSHWFWQAHGKVRNAFILPRVRARSLIVDFSISNHQLNGALDCTRNGIQHKDPAMRPEQRLEKFRSGPYRGWQVAVLNFEMQACRVPDHPDENIFTFVKRSNSLNRGTKLNCENVVNSLAPPGESLPELRREEIMRRVLNRLPKRGFSSYSRLAYHDLFN